MEMQEITTKFEQIKKIYQELRMTHDSIKGITKTIKKLQNTQTIKRLDIYYDINSAQQVEGNNILWQALQPLIIQDLTNKLEETKQKYKELCNQYEKSIFLGKLE